MRNLIDRAFNFVSEIHGRARDVVAANARLDNENTALRRELAIAKEGRRALASDLYALSRGESVETDGGAAVEHRIQKLTDELEAMRPVFLPIGPHSVSVKSLLYRLRGAGLSVRAHLSSLTELIGRFEAYDRKVQTSFTPAAPHVVGVYNTGEDSWTHGERNAEGRRHLGPCPECGARTVDHGRQWRCTRVGCSLSDLTPHPHPFWWASDIFVELDGSNWLAARFTFTNIQESLCGFGRTPANAVTELRISENSARANDAPLPTESGS